jgi:hypothetical protein
MVVNQDGHVLVGKSVVDTSVVGLELRNNGVAAFTATATNALSLRRLSSDGTILQFNRDGTTVGSVSVTTTATAYNTSSDARLKHDIEDAPEASSVIDGIRIRTFRWNADDSEQRFGMIAQELIEVAPEAVTGSPDDEEEMMAVDYSKLVPMLIKEIQSLRVRMAGQEAAMSAMEARLAALEAGG